MSWCHCHKAAQRLQKFLLNDLHNCMIRTNKISATSAATIQNVDLLYCRTIRRTIVRILYIFTSNTKMFKKHTWQLTERQWLVGVWSKPLITRSQEQLLQATRYVLKWNQLWNKSSRNHSGAWSIVGKMSRWCDFGFLWLISGVERGARHTSIDGHWLCSLPYLVLGDLLLTLKTCFGKKRLSNETLMIHLWIWITLPTFRVGCTCYIVCVLHFVLLITCVLHFVRLIICACYTLCVS